MNRPGRRAATAMRRVAAASVFAAALALPSATADAQSSAVLSLDPEALSLGGGPGVIDVRIAEAPAVGGYEFVLSFDSSLVVVTAVEDGGFLSSTGGGVSFTPRFEDGNNLVIHAEAVDLIDGDALPSGSGSLARVTLAPVASGGPAPLGLTEASLTGDGGEPVEVGRTVGGAVTVVQTPPEAVQTDAVAQATALADSLSGDGGTNLVPDMPDIGGASAELIWLGLFVVAVAVVLAGWLFGRRPEGY